MKTSVKVLEPNNQDFDLSAALLLYKSNTGQVYATAHRVVDHPHLAGPKQLGPGCAATKEALAEFAGAVLESTAYRGLIPANLLYTAPDTMAWWAPASPRHVWFKSADKGIGTTSVSCMHPPLVFVATEGNWYVFALREDARPDANTKLYKAPYYNVWEGGRICTGNVVLPAARGPEVIRGFELAFFRSNFTHSNDKRLVKFAGGAAGLWARQIAAPDNPLLLDPKILIDTKKTFEQTLQRITGDAK